MPLALNLLRPSLHYRREAFNDGLRAAGFDVVEQLRRPVPEDVLVCWNRYAGFHEQALQFETCGAAVLIVENGLLGKAWRGGEWFSLARGRVAMCGGQFQEGGPDRWDSWGVDLAPYRDAGREVVILGQRGIGEPDVRSPDRWAERVRSKVGGRIRQHPGAGPALPLEADLHEAAAVVTWASGAALLAMAAGVPVWCDHPSWIGAQAARALRDWPGEHRRDESARLEVFRRAAWAMWTLDEIRTGEPIRRLMQ